MLGKILKDAPVKRNVRKEKLSRERLEATLLDKTKHGVKNVLITPNQMRIYLNVCLLLVHLEPLL